MVSAPYFAKGDTLFTLANTADYEAEARLVGDFENLQLVGLRGRNYALTENKN